MADSDIQEHHSAEATFLKLNTLAKESSCNADLTDVSGGGVGGGVLHITQFTASLDIRTYSSTSPVIKIPRAHPLPPAEMLYTRQWIIGRCC